MDEKVKQEWLDALRSGHFSQGKETLRRHDEDGMYEFCCLGVLCEIAGNGHWDGCSYVQGSSDSDIQIPRDLAASLGLSPLPAVTREQLAPLWDEFNGEQRTWIHNIIARRGGTISLDMLNDSEHDFDFKTIARIIEVCL